MLQQQQKHKQNKKQQQQYQKNQLSQQMVLGMLYIHTQHSKTTLVSLTLSKHYFKMDQRL